MAAVGKFVAGLLLATVQTLAWPAAIEGRVVGVSDGDTITVLDAAHRRHKVRLAGIDAPEKAQAFGQRAKMHLSERIHGKAVVVEWRKQDRYGRVIGKVVVGSTDVCLDQIQRGLAWHYKAYARDQAAADRQRYAAAEDAARTSRAGLWRDADPVPPWHYRRR